MKQGELFEDLKSRSPLAKPDEEDHSPEERFAVVLTMDKIVFIILAVLILLIVVFTFGIEHGKKLQSELSRSKREVESITSLAEISAVQKSLAKQPEENVGRPLDKAMSAIEAEPVKPTPKPKKKFKLKIPFLSSLFGKHKAPDSKTKTTEPSSVEENKQVEPLPLPPISMTTADTAVPVEVVSSKSQAKKDETSAAEKKKETKEEKSVTKGYEVRIMSVVEKTFADKAATRLGKDGLSASVRKSGNYYILLLGPYKTREEADSMIKKVKKLGSYKDAYIRHLS